jgi:hypothetical protein
MKIDPAQVRPAATRRVGTAQPTSSGGFAAALHEETGGGGSQSAVGGSVGLSGLSTILALQGAPDSTERRARQRAVQRGEAMLEELEQIRLGLLLGQIPRARLEQLAQMVRARREQLDDPKLIAILDDIELRAAVELAKLSGPSGL